MLQRSGRAGLQASAQPLLSSPEPGFSRRHMLPPKRKGEVPCLSLFLPAIPTSVQPEVHLNVDHHRNGMAVLHRRLEAPVSLVSTIGIRDYRFRSDWQPYG